MTTRRGGARLLPGLGRIPHMCFLVLIIELSLGNAAAFGGASIDPIRCWRPLLGRLRLSE